MLFKYDKKINNIETFAKTGKSFWVWFAWISSVIAVCKRHGNCCRFRPVYSHPVRQPSVYVSLLALSTLVLLPWRPEPHYGRWSTSTPLHRNETPRTIYQHLWQAIYSLIIIFVCRFVKHMFCMSRKQHFTYQEDWNNFWRFVPSEESIHRIQIG